MNDAEQPLDENAGALIEQALEHIYLALGLAEAARGSATPTILNQRYLGQLLESLDAAESSAYRCLILLARRTIL